MIKKVKKNKINFYKRLKKLFSLEDYKTLNYGKKKKEKKKKKKKSKTMNLLRILKVG
jgi:hypothetical protein